MKSLERKIAEAASDYKAGLYNEDFAELNGGIDKLRMTLLDLVFEWELAIDEAAGVAE